MSMIESFIELFIWFFTAGVAMMLAFIAIGVLCCLISDLLWELKLIRMFGVVKYVKEHWKEWRSSK